MAKVKILIPGYVSEETNGHACSTISLVQDGNNKIIVDPGTASSQQVIKQALKKEKLDISDINVVFITHAHTDHYRNIGMFPTAATLDYWGWWYGDKSKKFNATVSNNIKIIKTPGHSFDSLTMIVKTKLGKIAICGDVFWKKDFPKKDKYASNLKLLQASRKKVLKSADYLIPGHGEMFKTK